MHMMAVDYFSSLFTSQVVYALERMVEVIPHLVTDAHNAMLCTVPTNEEIKAAIQSMPPDSSPGPDGR